MKHKLITFITIGLLAAIAFLFWGQFLFWILLSFILIAYLTITFLGSFQIQWNYFLNSVNTSEKDGVVFTFDDGPDPETTPMILEQLRAQNIKACFFVIGKKAEKHHELIRAIEKDGHIIGNHSYDHHVGMGFFPKQKLSADIEKCSKIVKDITGKTPTFFRPPFGVTNPRYGYALKKLNLMSIGWSGRSFDTISSNKDALIARVKKHVKPGTILLFHDDQKITVEALPEIIHYCKEKGIKIVSLT